MLLKISSSSRPRRSYSLPLGFALLQLLRFSSLYMQRGNSGNCRQKMSNYCSSEVSSVAGLKLLIRARRATGHWSHWSNNFISMFGFKEASRKGKQRLMQISHNKYHKSITKLTPKASKETKQVCCLLSLCLLSNLNCNGWNEL